MYFRPSSSCVLCAHGIMPVCRGWAASDVRRGMEGSGRHAFCAGWRMAYGGLADGRHGGRERCLGQRLKLLVYSGIERGAEKLIFVIVDMRQVGAGGDGGEGASHI